MILLENVDTAELQLRVLVNGWVAFTQQVPRDGHLQREYHSEAGTGRDLEGGFQKLGEKPWKIYETMGWHGQCG